MQELSKDKFLQSRGELKNHPAPEKPSYFDEHLLRMGGVNSLMKPNLRAIWGMDPSVTQFWCGWQLMVYHDGWMEHHQVVGADIYDPKLDKRTTLGKKDTLHLLKTNKHHKVPKRAMVNIRETVREDEVGTARWMIERWQPTDEIGIADWELYRYELFSLDDVNLKELPKEVVELFPELNQCKIDVLGPCPMPGRYTCMMVVEDDDGQFRELDMRTIQQLEDHLDGAKEKVNYTPQWLAQQSADRLRERRARGIKDMGDRIRDRLKNKANVIFGNPYHGYNKGRENLDYGSLILTK